MRAIVVHEPGGPEVLQLEERPVPEPRPGWALVRVRAFGLNRSELTTRAGGSGDAVKFPRVLGIECVGEVADPSDTDLAAGAKVAALMGGMGREFDGGYAEYALLPAEHTIPVETGLAWERFGAIPESFATAWKSLEKLDLAEGQALLVRGGSSALGMAATTLAKARGVTVISTTRQEAKADRLREGGADHIVIDDGEIADAVRELAPDGVDALLELVGPKAMRDSLRAVRTGGRSCISGFLEHDWNSEPAEAEAARLGVEFARYSSGTSNRDNVGDAIRESAAGVESGRYFDIVDRTFALDEIGDAHRYMEENRAAGKVVVVT